MAKLERVRESFSGRLDLEDINRKISAGWRLVSLEWERESAEEEQPKRRWQEPPYGLKVAEDCFHLEENPQEMGILHEIMELIGQDYSLPRMADELNRRGFATREGKPWTTLSIFNVFPRLIDATPEIFSTEKWQDRRKEISRIMWNS
ncbi:MAG TPA: recombinase family protein [Candidatus Acidoferrales bacterium]|nr:recombinase family protein [Candidatus Acidoferrales bacterium]